MSKIHLTALGLLNERPMHGYELQQVVRERDLDKWAGVNPNSVYKALQTLEAKGLIVGHEETEGNNPPRTVFSITKKGKEELEALVRSFLHVDVFFHQFLIGVAFVQGVLTRQEFIGYIDAHITKSERIHKKKEEDTRRILELHPDLPFNWRVLMKVGETMGENMRARLQELRDQAVQCAIPGFFKSQ